MNKYHKCINYLMSKDTMLVPHGNKNFFTHLVGVYDYLKKTGQDEDVCYAGMFHSIYGNDIFTKKTEENRKTIKDLIGEKAEELVWIFNTTPREDLHKLQNNSIQKILTANELDQNNLFKVMDNVFDNRTIDLLYDSFRGKKPWRFIGGGVEGQWRKFNYSLNSKDKIDSFLFQEATNILNKEKLTNFVKFKRAYASGNIFGTVHDLHVDDFCDNYNQIYTIMFYLNKIWDVKYGGETIFLNRACNNIDASVIPRPGRAVLFDGFIPHGARELSRQCAELRIVATFKYEVINV